MPILTSCAEVERKFPLCKKVRTDSRHARNFEYELPLKLLSNVDLRGFINWFQKAKIK